MNLSILETGGVKQMLDDNPGLSAEIEAKIKAKVMASVEVVAPEPVELD